MPLRDCGDNEQSLVPLCNACHSHKSYLESMTPFQDNPIASVFEKSVFQAFHDSPKPRQAVQQIHTPAKTQAVEIDTIRCRRNAFDQNLEPIPIFSPIDEIRPLDDFVLGDYNFVDKDVSIEHAARYARMLPYSGKRWYWKASVQYMLNRGIIKWTDIKYKLTASAHVDCDFFKHIFATIEETQQNIRTADLDRIELPEFGKIVSMLYWAFGQNQNNIGQVWRQSHIPKICKDLGRP